MSSPRVAVVVTSFNLGRTLLEAIASVRSQTLPAAELVVVDDGSTDLHTRQVLAVLEREGVRVVRTANRGVGAARNLGARLTTSPYLVFLDADDALEPGYLEQAATLLDSRPDLAFVSCAMRAVGTTNGDFTPLPQPLPEAVASHVTHVSSIMRRSLWEAVGGWDEGFTAYEELDFWTSVQERGFRGEVLQQPLFRYRMRRGSMARSALGEKHAGHMRRFYDKHWQAVTQQWDEVLLAKERFIVKQREYQRDLVRRVADADAALDPLGHRIHGLHQRLHAAGGEVVALGDLRRTRPLSSVWGLDRGRPVDRYYIEAFLEAHRTDIHGSVLEIKDPGYTKQFGGERVTRSEVLDIDAGNDDVTIVADLTRAEAVPSDSFDCFILTQTVSIIFDVRAALREALRLLKPGGVLLCTVSAVTRVSFEDRGLDGDYWRFTEASLRELFAELLPVDAFEVSGYGNVLACSAFLYGLAIHELSREELDDHDPYFPLGYAVRAVKPAPRSSAGQASGRAVVLMYHRVAETVLDPHGIAVPPALFAEHLKAIREEAEVISLEALVRAVRAGSLPERAVAVTLDDGYLDALTTAAPLLAAAGVSATVFMTGEGLEEATEFWWDVLARALLGNHPLPPTIAVDVAGLRLELATGSASERRRAHDLIWDLIFPLQADAQQAAIASVLAACGVAAEPTGNDRPLLADELRRLADAPGITIGSHSTHHLRLSGQPPDARRAEVQGHRNRLEEILGRPVTLFSYPFGELDPALVTLVRESGFAGAVSVNPGAVTAASDPCALPRLDVKTWSAEELRARLRSLLEG